MINLPPSENDLHAYVDHQLDEDDRRRIDSWLANHPQVAARVHAWQQDAQHLRTAFAGPLHPVENQALDPAIRRRQISHRRYGHLARAAVLMLAVGIGGLSGWQARALLQWAPAAPMTDALQAYRLFAEQGVLPADFKVQDGATLQSWLDHYFANPGRLPDLQAAGFKAVSARLLTTDQGAAAMVLYEDHNGHRVTFYIRPPGPDNGLLPRGSRRDGELQAEYWSAAGYNYAMVSQADEPALPLLKALPSI